MVKGEGKARVVDPNRGDLLDIFKDSGLSFHPILGNFMYCPTGEPYLTVVSAGVKKEGAKAKLFETERGAVDAWNKTIRHMIAECKPTKSGFCGILTVYWRRMPEMMFFEPAEVAYGRWTVYSRLRISRQPVIHSADYNLIRRGEGVDHG